MGSGNWPVQDSKAHSNSCYETWSVPEILSCDPGTGLPTYDLGIGVHSRCTTQRMKWYQRIRYIALSLCNLPGEDFGNPLAKGHFNLSNVNEPMYIYQSLTSLICLKQIKTSPSQQFLGGKPSTKGLRGERRPCSYYNLDAEQMHWILFWAWGQHLPLCGHIPPSIFPTHGRCSFTE